MRLDVHVRRRGKAQIDDMVAQAFTRRLARLAGSSSRPAQATNQTITSAALLDAPRAIEPVGAEVIAVNAVVQASGVSPHPPGALVIRVDLQEEPPILRARRELERPRISSVFWASAIDAIGREMTLVK